MKKFIEKHGLTASTLKWSAIIFMIINHLCYSLYYTVGLDNYFLSDVHWYLTRFAFVIFAFQITEGMHYTRNKGKYIKNLFLFAAISQIPYNFCFLGTAFATSNFCVLWTLGIAATVMAVIDKTNRNPFVTIVATLVGVIVGYALNAEYAIMGIPMMVMFFYFRDCKWKKLTFSAIVFMIGAILEFFLMMVDLGYTPAEALRDPWLWYAVFQEWHGLIAWILIFFYSGRKGKNINKWFFYGFYPGHITIIYLLSLLLIKII